MNEKYILTKSKSSLSNDNINATVNSNNLNALKTVSIKYLRFAFVISNTRHTLIYLFLKLRTL